MTPAFLPAVFLWTFFLCVFPVQAESLRASGMCGWKKLGDGTWNYYSYGELATDTWIEDGGKRYYFDSSGAMLTGWREIEGERYYFSPMTEGLHLQGECYSNELTPDGCFVDYDGSVLLNQVKVSEEAAGRENPSEERDVVEVDITAQHVYCYRGNVLLWDSPCVSGNINAGRRTPTGEFDIIYKARSVYLTGPMREDGTPAWHNYVDYWMPFHNGCGFHDASWRGSFGGTIYRRNGSHGCVNLPVSAAGKLYMLAYPGMHVSVHE